MKEYINETLCIIGFHRYGEWKNESQFIDTGRGFNFGWIARYGKKCKYCDHYSYKTPFLKSEREKLINEKNNRKY